VSLNPQSFPTYQDLLDPLLQAFHEHDGRMTVEEQLSEMPSRLQLSKEQLAMMHTPRRSKIDYRLAWARNYLKRIGLLENVDRGVWQLTAVGRSHRKVPPGSLRQLGLALESSEAAAAAGTGVEAEDVDAKIVKPFDPTLIRVEIKPATLGQLISRIENDEIDLDPDFQRKGGIWTEAAQSRLIESILVRIPIPAFYFDGANEDKWVVVDGLQRLTSLKRFVIEGTLKLQGLEFLDTMDGKHFSELPRSLQRRIFETSATVFLIEKNTPPTVKFNIFKRINTGGLPLSPQEIRHALYQGPVTQLLIHLSESREFQIATDFSIRDERMADRECVLRFLAFSLHPPETYRDSDFDGFLSESMAEINALDEQSITQLKNAFNQAMETAFILFGRDAFRKPITLYKRRMPLNKALFEAWSVNLGQLSRPSISELIAKNQKVVRDFEGLCADADFSSAISQGTGDPVKVRRRFKRVEELIDTVLHD
jgi:hypothetical protein